MRKSTILAAATVTAVGAVALGGTAYAGPKTLFNQASTSGSYTAGGDGAARLTGAIAGDPFDGAYSATLAADDGSLPAPGECEAATATIRVEGVRKGHYEITGSGPVCGQWVDATYQVTHVFTGRYIVTDASQHKLTGTDGWYSIRLATENRAGIEVIDT
jgi:hypothetical protein